MNNHKSKRFHFTLIELLVVIAILAVLISLLQPSLRRVMFEGKNLQCVNNLKGQGVGYLMYCDDNSDLYPSVDSGWERGSIYQYGSALGKQLSPYFENGEAMESNAFSKVVAAYKCPMGFESQNHARYRNNKVYYGLFFNATDMFASNNSRSMRTDLKHPYRMRRMGDTWTWTMGVNSQKFNLLAMDGNKLTQGWGSSEGIYSNHFKLPPDLKRGSSGGTGFVPHQSRLGEVVINFLFDDGSSKTRYAYYDELIDRSPDGWYKRSAGGAGSETWLVPQEYSLGSALE